MSASIKRGRGQPPFVPTAKDRASVKVMVAGGIQQAEIAKVLGISHVTLSKYFRQEIDVGVTEVAMLVIAAHLKRIKQGDMRAIEWWEKSRLGWSEKVVVEDNRADRPMRVVVELVGDAPAEPRAVHIEGTTASRTGIDPSRLVELIG